MHPLLAGVSKSELLAQHCSLLCLPRYIFYTDLAEVINNRHVSEQQEAPSVLMKREKAGKRWLAGLGWGCVTAGIQRWQTDVIEVQSFRPITAAHWSLRQGRALHEPAEEWSNCGARRWIPGIQGGPRGLLLFVWGVSDSSVQRVREEDLRWLFIHPRMKER